MKDPTIFTEAVLKEKLWQMNLNTAGNKAELISRLHEADLYGQWIIDIDAEVSGKGEAAGNVTTVQETETNE